MNNFDTLGKKLVEDIDSAYDDAEKVRIQNIQISVSDLIEHFKRQSLSLFGIANLDAIDHYGQIPIYENRPVLIKIGYYQHLRLPNLAIKIPAVIDVVESNGINIAYHKLNEESACNFLQNIALRLVLSMPDGLIDLKVFDASSNGASFKLLLALEKAKANFYSTEKAIIDELESITQSLTDIQTEKLSFKYNTVEEYNLNNEQKIPFQILVFNNYPEIFLYRNNGLVSLKKIIENAKRFGIIVLLGSDVDKINNNSIFRNELVELEKKIGRIEINNDQNLISSTVFELNSAKVNFKINLDFDIPSKKAEIVSFLNNRFIDHLELENDKNRSAYNFDGFYSKVKTDGKFWCEKSNECIKIPLGFPLNYKLSEEHHAYFYFGDLYDKKGNRVGSGNQHCLIGGTTGSGKSVLINNIIINSCYLYPPTELQFVVIDLKGSEYLEYKRLPHVKILFQDPSKIDVALNVLEFIKSCFEERVQCFRKYGVAEFLAYRKYEQMPRLLCIIDEFQTFNQNSNSEVKRRSTEIIDLIAGKGRAYGIHLILASQSLSNVNINQASMTNINVRLVLRLDEVASRYILSPGNNETLKFPDLQLVYNNVMGYERSDNKIIKLPFLKGGLVKDHINFFETQLTENKNYNKVRFLLPGDKSVLIESNSHIKACLEGKKAIITNNKIYLGKPYFIKDEDNHVALNPESENNILMIGHDYNVAYRVIFLSICQFLAINPNNKVYYVNYTPKSSKFYNIFNPLINDNFLSINVRDAENVYDLLINEISDRKEADSLVGDTLLLLPQLNSDTSLNARLSPLMGKIKNIIETGPSCGIYSFVYVDSYNSMSEIGVINNFSKFKISLKGGDSHKIMPNKLEVDENDFIYLSAPSPFTIMNPDYIQVFNGYADNSYSSELYHQVITNLFEKV